MRQDEFLHDMRAPSPATMNLTTIIHSLRRTLKAVVTYLWTPKNVGSNSLQVERLYQPRACTEAINCASRWLLFRGNEMKRGNDRDR